MKTLLKNGMLYDGSGAAPVKGDILIEDDRIPVSYTHLTLPTKA